MRERAASSRSRCATEGTSDRQTALGWTVRVARGPMRWQAVRSVHDSDYTYTGNGTATSVTPIQQHKMNIMYAVTNWCTTVDSDRRCLIISLLFEPAAGVAAQVEAPDLVVDEDGQHERNGGQPPHEPEQKREPGHRPTIISSFRIKTV